MRNLNVVVKNKTKISKNGVHKIVFFLKKELNFSLDSLVVNFVNSENIHQINKKYLNHDYSTDIITFNYSGDNNILDGEIFISVEDAEYNSKKYDVILDNELLRLIIHGILHLLGFDDINASDKRKMKKIENKLVETISTELNLRLT